MITSLEFGCAANLYSSGRHPRLLLNPEDLDALRLAAASGWPARILQGLRLKTAPLIQRVQETADLAALLGNPTGVRNGGDPRGKEVAACLDDIALVGLLDKDHAALDAVRRVLSAAPASHGNNFNTAFAYDLVHPMLTPEERAVFVKWALAHVERMFGLAGPVYLLSAGGNIGMTYTLESLMYSVVILGDEGVPGMRDRLDYLVKAFEAAIYSAIGPEGYPAEDIGYGTLMAARLLRMATVLRRAGIFDAYERCPRLAKFGRAMLHFVQPWGGFLSNTGDHGDDFGARDLALSHLARVNNDPTLTWLLATISYPCIEPEHRDSIPPIARETTVGPGMQVPTSAVALITLADAPPPVHPRQAGVPTAFHDTDRGIASFRSGWRDDDTFVYFDGSLRPTSAQGHAHDSGGHFCLSSVGEYFAVSPGRYGIEQDQHNTLLVDGKSGRSTEGEWRSSWYHSQLTHYRPDPLCDYASADTSHQTASYWAFRHIGLVKGGGLPGYAWTVDDVNGANDFRSFWWTLYTAPGNKIELTGNHASVHGRGGGVLDVHFAIPPANWYPNPHTLELSQDMPWTSSHKYVDRDFAKYREKHYVHHATFNRPRLVAKVSGYNGRVLSIMVPRRAGDPAPVVESIPAVMGALAMRVVRGGFEDTVIFAYGHSLLEAGDVRARGRWVVVRRDEQRRYVGHAIHQGELLEVDGKNIRL